MFQIGEFSKIAQVSGRLLRYYDQRDLLKPEYIDPQTGYRFYTITQLPRLNRILALKELGLSLEQIKRLLDDNVSADEIRGMLTLKKAQVEQTLLDEMARFRYIETRIDQINREGTLQNYDIVLKSIPQHRFLSTRRIFSGLYEAQLLGVELTRHLPSQVRGSALGHIMVIIHSDVWQDEDLDFEFGFVVEDEIEQESFVVGDTQLAIRDVPAVEHMLTIVRVGRPSLGHGHYSALGDWVAANGYRFAGKSRELFYQFPFPDREHETVAEIRFPVEKIDTPLPRLG